MGTHEEPLGPEEQAILIRLTRSTLESAVQHRPPPPRAELNRLGLAHPRLAQPRGAFVTIYVADLLRGCLGEVEPEAPLLDVVVRCAQRVPLYDYRFPAVRAAELGALTFKISVLGMPERVESLSEVRIGTHGLMVRHDGQAGLLLPDVAVEYGWDVPTFLDHLWRKAGIPAHVPLMAVQLWRFTSQLLGSADDPAKA